MQMKALPASVITRRVRVWDPRAVICRKEDCHNAGGHDRRETSGSSSSAEVMFLCHQHKVKAMLARQHMANAANAAVAAPSHVNESAQLPRRPEA